jgi:hypothetical protein
MEDFDSALDSVELSAMQGECIYQVDLFPADVNRGFPIMIQFLIGHLERSSLLWHEDGRTLIAVEKHVAPLTYTLQCERFAGREDVEPNLTMVTPAIMRDSLTLFFLTNERPEIVTWIESEQD